RREPPGREPPGRERPDWARREPPVDLEPLGPDEEVVAGRRPVEEAFAARRSAVRLLVTPQRRAALERIVLHATSLRIPIVQVDGLAGALTDLHVRGIRIVGAEADAPLTARQADLRGPIALVVGSEGQGLGPTVRRRCDLVVRIPMRGVVGSLNAAVAGSILLFEALAQRDSALADVPPPTAEPPTAEPPTAEPAPAEPAPAASDAPPRPKRRKRE